MLRILQRLCLSLVAQQSCCHCRCASAMAVVAPRLTARQRAMAQAGRAALLPAMQRCAPRALKFHQSPHPAGTLRRPLMARRSASEQKSSAAHRPAEAVRASPLPPVRLQGIVGRSRSYPSAAEVQFECEARRWPRSPWLSLLYMARALRTQAQRTEGRGARLSAWLRAGLSTLHSSTSKESIQSRPPSYTHQTAPQTEPEPRQSRRCPVAARYSPVQLYRGSSRALQLYRALDSSTVLHSSTSALQVDILYTIHLPATYHRPWACSPPHLRSEDAIHTVSKFFRALGENLVDLYFRREALLR